MCIEARAGTIRLPVLVVQPKGVHCSGVWRQPLHLVELMVLERLTDADIFHGRDSLGLQTVWSPARSGNEMSATRGPMEAAAVAGQLGTCGGTADLNNGAMQRFGIAFECCLRLP